jgi:type VI secretion system protein ImpF
MTSRRRLRNHASDLSWLLNTTHLAARHDLSAYPQVERSTVNYGVPDLSGKTSSTVDVTALEKAIRAAIWEFEPRLLRRSVRIKVVVNEEQMSHNALSFLIEAELWAQPLPLRLYLKTDLDLETGKVLVSETTSPD